jgi:hypothetical protein
LVRTRRPLSLSRAPRASRGIAGTLLFTAVTTLVGCSGTGDGGSGDPSHPPSANQLGDGDRLAELIGPATWFNETDDDSQACTSPPDRAVHVSGVTIVGIDRFDETGDGARGNFYVQDTVPPKREECGDEAPGCYSGITVFDPSFSPPDLRLAQGDVADLSGVLMEFLGPSTGRFKFCKTLPEIGGTMSFRFESPGAVAPRTIAIADLKSYETARKWLGMLVRIENVRIVGDPSNSGGRYKAAIDVGGGIAVSDQPRISNELYDLEGEGPPLAADTQFTAVTGVLTFFFNFNIAPRSASDFEP